MLRPYLNRTEARLSHEHKWRNELNQYFTTAVQMSSLNKQLRKKVADLQSDLLIRGSFTCFKCFGFMHFGGDAIGSSWIQIVDLLVAWRPLALIMMIMEALSCLFETAAKIITAVKKAGIFFNPTISSLLSNRRVQSRATQSRAEKKVTCFFKSHLSHSAAQQNYYFLTETL